MAEGVQLATAYVNIEASTKGLGKQITQALGKVDTGRLGQQAGTTWGRGFLSRLAAAGYLAAGTKIGRQISDGVGNGIDKNALDGLKRAVESAEATVITASKNMKTAKLNEQAAQARVNETIQKYGATSSKAYEAQARLAQAELRTENASKSLDDAQRKLADAQETLNKASSGYKTPNTGRLSSALAAITSGYRNAAKSADTFRISGLSIGAVAGVVSSLTGRIASGLGGVASAAIEASDSTDKFKSTMDFAGIDTATIDRLTASTQAYADATVYDLADIRNVTAQLAANGVRGYDRLAEAAGNLNSVAGGTSETYRTVGMVLTQTAGAGKLTTENFNQLSDAIPGASGKIQNALRDMGAYTGNFRDAMEKGEISAEEFNQAILDLGMTDAAQEAAKSTKTFEGAIGNWDAAIQKLVTKGLDAVKPAFTKALGGATDVVSRFTDDISDNLDDLQDRFDKAVDRLMEGDLAGAVGQIFDLDPNVVNDLTDSFDMVSDGIGEVIDALTDATPGLDGANSTFELLSGTLKTISPLLPAVADLIGLFTDLPGPVQLAAVGLIAFHRPLGDIISIAKGAGSLLGGIAKGITGIGSTARDASGKTSGLSGAIGGFNPASIAFAAASGIVIGAVTDFATQSERAKGLSAGLRDAMKADADAISQYWESIRTGDNEDAELTFLEKLKSGFKADDLAGLLDKTGIGMDTFKQAVSGSSEALDQIKELEQRYFNNPSMMGSFDEIEERITNLSDTYRQAIGEMIDASQSLEGIDSAYAKVSSSVSGLGTTLKANGDAMNGLSSMSEASRGALEQFSAAVWQNADSIIANSDAYGGMDAAIQAAKNRVQEMRDALIGQLTALGQTPEQAAAVADALGLIPSNVDTTAAFDDGMARLEVQAYLDTLNLTPEQKTTFMQALTDAANGDIDSLKLNMDTLPEVVTSFLKADPSDATAQTNAVMGELQTLGAMEPTALLKADKTDADSNTQKATTSVRTFGTQTGTAKLDADNTQAIGNTKNAKGLVDEFGNCRATAVVDVQDNASGTLSGILGQLQSIAGRAWNAVVDLFTGGGHAYGGLVDGGKVTGPGSRMSDTATITPLSAGEYVIRARSASRIGYRTLDQINKTGRIPTTGTRPTDDTGTATGAQGAGLTREDITLAMIDALSTMQTVKVGTPESMALALAEPLDQELARRSRRRLS